jgi:zinc/manganese transport system substrate-binding protein
MRLNLVSVIDSARPRSQSAAAHLLRAATDHHADRSDPVPTPTARLKARTLRSVLEALSLALVAVALTVLASGCGRSGPAVASSAGHPRIAVVAAENFWGSIAAQLGGARVSVMSIIVNPSTDPHSYQPSAGDARAISGAQMVIVNGLGYDKWASQLMEGSASESRVVLDVGHSLGLGAGANPHRWYYPADVHALIAQITASYERLDPADASYFASQRHSFESVALGPYDRLRATIRAHYTGVPVGYSESIFQGLGEDLGLRLLTPPGFARAVAEGTDVSAQDKLTVDAQVRDRRIKLWVFNSQNVTPDVQRVNALVQQQAIPVARVTETLAPVSASFEQWQVAELEGLLRGLRLAVGR